VYQAVDMCIPGILGFRSILNGGDAVEVPDLRCKCQRDKYRNDTFCAFQESAGDQWVDAMAMQPDKSETPDEVYEMVRQKWLNGEPG